MGMLYANIDQRKTIQEAKQFLKDYHMWKVEAARFHSWVKSPTLSSLPQVTGKTNGVEARMTEAANAGFECDLRVKTLNQLASLDKESAMYADLLRFRYIEGWLVTKVANQLATKYELGYMAERTYTNYLNKALWEFAIICPRDLMIMK